MSASNNTSSSGSTASAFQSIGEMVENVVNANTDGQSATGEASTSSSSCSSSSTRENTETEQQQEHQDDEEEEEMTEEEKERAERRKITYEAGGAITVLKSLCMNCGETGRTRLLLTRIPFFRDIILMAFECEECGFRNSEVQPAEVQAKGCHFEVTVNSAIDLNRQLVKGDKATVFIKELDFEIPAITQAGVFTTIEGLLDRAMENLGAGQPIRQATDPEGAASVEAFLVKLKNAKEGVTLPFTFILDDPSGNSFVENPHAPKTDHNMRIRYYSRSTEQNESLGLAAGNARDEGGAAGMEEQQQQQQQAGAGTGAETDAAVGAGGGTGSSSSEEGGGSSEDNNNAVERQPTSRNEAGEEVGDSTGFTGSSAATVYPNTDVDTKAAATAAADYKEGVERMRAAMRDMSGNVPGGFKKGGALITGHTTRAILTAAGQQHHTHNSSKNNNKGSKRAVGASGAGGSGLAGLIFESSASATAKEVLTFPQDCFNCSARGEVRMCVTDVPHFKEVILMSFACDECGWKNVEVKGGGAVPEFGSVHELSYVPGRPRCEEDLARDVIKGDTAGVEIPELELELQAGTLGGMYTTCEGLITAIRDKLLETDPFSGGESTDSGSQPRISRMKDLVDKLDACIAGQIPFTLRMRDPMANTWIFSPYVGVLGALQTSATKAPGSANSIGGGDADLPTRAGVDPSLTITHYTRTHEEDLELGILDMNAPREDSDEEEEEEEEGEREGEGEKTKVKEGEPEKTTTAVAAAAATTASTE